MLNFVTFLKDKAVSKITCETKTEVNMEATIPMLRVMANPFIGPVPN